MKVRAVFEFQWVLFILSAMEFNQKMWAFSSPCSFYLPTAFFEKKKTKCFRSTAEGKRAFEKSYFFRVNFVTGAVNCEIVSILCVFVTPDSGNIFVERFNYWKIRLKSTSTSASKVCFCRWNGSFGRNREKCLEKCDSAGTQNNDVCRIGEWIFDQRICRLSRLQEHIQTFFDEAETYEESEGQNGKSSKRSKLCGAKQAISIGWCRRTRDSEPLPGTPLHMIQIWESRSAWIGAYARKTEATDQIDEYLWRR